MELTDFNVPVLINLINAHEITEMYVDCMIIQELKHHQKIWFQLIALCVK